ncbi:hypothetical protein L873DRAFT_603764 [Choiromyces venosus 120613-1]|uniref:Uncharacterized protein n=1 Tax=Choiromyces venosus 120613-1 TaxID=1336337 RepID=A0A3N4JX79_9PEZI|nr:hypothetical protein L873DRAFT_603764 [Choiromyces venosus 120613-1]
MKCLTPHEKQKTQPRLIFIFLFLILHLEFLFCLDVPTFDSFLYFIARFLYQSFHGWKLFYSSFFIIFTAIWRLFVVFSYLRLWLALPVCISLSDDDASIYIERDHGRRVIFLKDSISCVDGVNVFLYLFLKTCLFLLSIFGLSFFLMSNYFLFHLPSIYY